MKVNPSARSAMPSAKKPQNTAKANVVQNDRPAKDDEKEAVKARIREKFGVELGKKIEAKKPDETKEGGDVVVSVDSKGKKKVEGEVFGDIKKNDPGSDVTQEKLKGLLRSGGFHFNNKERAALDAILNK